MIKSKLIFGLLLGVYVFTFATPLLSEDSYRFQYVVEFSREELSLDKVLQYDIARMYDGSWLADVAKPMLPSREIRIAVPAGMAVRGVSIIDTKSETIPGEYNIYPAQPPRKIEPSDTDIEFVEPDPTTYSSSQPYPPRVAEFVHQSDLAGQGIAHVLLYPVQYVPAEKKLVFYTSINLMLEGTGGYEYGHNLSSNMSEKSRETYKEMVTNMVVNPEDVQLGMSITLGGSAYLPEASFDHVIITSTTYAPDFQPLADWHTKRGVRDTVITNTWIYDNYSGSSNQEKIRNFIIDACTTWGAIYYLLGGEHGTIPFEYKNYGEGNTPSDQYYSDYDDDWINEVYVGRITVVGSAYVTSFVNKVLKYEKDPPRTDYPLDILLVGMDLDASTPCEYMKESIDYYIPSRFNVTKVYDSDPSNHKLDVINALNAGQNLVNHADHSNVTVMCTGDFHHNSCLTQANVNALTNEDKMCIIFSVGCYPNSMDYSDCIAETFVKYNPNKAGVAFVGNTRDGLYQPGSCNSLSGALDIQWWRAIFSYNKYNLGQILATAKHNTGHGSSSQMHCEWELNLLGEPEMPIWTDEPDSFAVSFPSVLPAGTSSFTVHVEDSSTHSPVYQAYVCLWKGDEVYLRGSTDTGGDITFNPSPSTNGEMYVTVTKHNYIPYEGQVFVASPMVSTNPATEEEETSATINGYLEDDAGYEASCWLFWDTDSGGPYANSESLGVFPNGSEYSKQLTGLTEGTPYYFIAKAHNAAGWGEGEELAFLTKPLPPSELTSEAIDWDTIGLSWIKPESADRTIIERNDTLIWERGEGTEVYNDTGTSYEDSGLEPLSHYYYQAWSYCTEGELYQYSDDYDTTDAITLFRRGDADANKEINVSDVIYLINYLFKGGPAPLPVLEAGDADCDTEVRVSDVVYLINYLFKGGPEPRC